jgi:hypothetical protein
MPKLDVVIEFEYTLNRSRPYKIYCVSGTDYIFGRASRF